MGALPPALRAGSCPICSLCSPVIIYVGPLQGLTISGRSSRKYVKVKKKKKGINMNIFIFYFFS